MRESYDHLTNSLEDRAHGEVLLQEMTAAHDIRKLGSRCGPAVAKQALGLHAHVNHVTRQRISMETDPTGKHERLLHALYLGIESLRTGLIEGDKRLRRRTNIELADGKLANSLVDQFRLINRPKHGGLHTTQPTEGDLPLLAQVKSVFQETASEMRAQVHGGLSDQGVADVIGLHRAIHSIIDGTQFDTPDEEARFIGEIDHALRSLSECLDSANPHVEHNIRQIESSRVSELFSQALKNAVKGPIGMSLAGRLQEAKLRGRSEIVATLESMDEPK